MLTLNQIDFEIFLNADIVPLMSVVKDLNQL